ncbi:MAG TPA: cellulase family glycosylhydrolase [Terracidiphilus sp.]|nr:cellulase family glycosylhydrolase [Terracidiphilus sp.]
MRLVAIRISVSLAMVLVAAVQCAGQDRAADVKTAFSRAQHLRYGINASEWFAQSHDYSAARTDRYTDGGDIALMAKLGFDNVRLSIDPVPLEQEPFGPDGMNDEFLGRLDKVVDTMLADGLAVEIDIHPEEAYKNAIRTEDGAVDRFVALWSRLAAHYAGRDPERVFFEIMNEPEVHDSNRWAGILARGAVAIRQAAPRNTIIASGDNWSDIVDLLALHPLPDGNVIYNFHFYDPSEFTHQGANWGEPWWRVTHDIPYPPTEQSMAESLKEVPNPVNRYKLENYWLDRWDAEHIRGLINEAVAWASANNVPLTCNEFGAFREHMQPESRMRWIHDVRSSLDADGIGWTMWDYRGGFGVVWKQDGQPAKVDDAVVEALGLKE